VQVAHIYQLAVAVVGQSTHIHLPAAAAAAAAAGNTGVRVHRCGCQHTCVHGDDSAWLNMCCSRSLFGCGVCAA
jgi:hypothetical protein